MKPETIKRKTAESKMIESAIMEKMKTERCCYEYTGFSRNYDTACRNDAWLGLRFVYEK